MYPLIEMVIIMDFPQILFMYIFAAFKKVFSTLPLFLFTITRKTLSFKIVYFCLRVKLINEKSKFWSQSTENQKGQIGSHTENCCVNKMNWFLWATKNNHFW